MPIPNGPQPNEYGRPEHHGDEVELPTPNARQGVTGHNVRNVLVLSTGVVAVVFAIIYFLFLGG